MPSTQREKPVPLAFGVQAFFVYTLNTTHSLIKGNQMAVKQYAVTVEPGTTETLDILTDLGGHALSTTIRVRESANESLVLYINGSATGTTLYGDKELKLDRFYRVRELEFSNVASGSTPGSVEVIVGR